MDHCMSHASVPSAPNVDRWPRVAARNPRTNREPPRTAYGTGRPRAPSPERVVNLPVLRGPRRELVPAAAPRRNSLAFWAGVVVGALIVTFATCITMLLAVALEIRSLEGARTRAPRTGVITTMRALDMGPTRGKSPQTAPATHRRASSSALSAASILSAAL